MLAYRVQSSDNYHIYKVKFEGEGENLRAFCSCPACKKAGSFCKHIAFLLNGDDKLLIEPSDKIEDLKKISAKSPLLEKAKDYVPYYMRNMDKETFLMNEDINNLVDVGNYIDKLLADRKYEKKI
jgi:hypothetical protein